MCPSLLSALYLWRLCYDFDTGPFTKVTCFDLAKALEGGTAGWYGQALPVPLVARPSEACLQDLFDLGLLETRDSSSICLILCHLESIQIYKGNIKERICTSLQ
jgi:hypothetical protein